MLPPQPFDPPSEARRPMAGDLYTASQKPEVSAKLSRDIKSAILELRREFPGQKVEALCWNEHNVAVPLVVEVELPTRGPVNNVDIREREPIYLLLHRQYYPHKAPSVWSSRPDFPKAQLPHLNPTQPGKAANLCLHRGSLDNWFAEHTIIDLVQRARGWLRDAARDRLIRQEDAFEPTRIIGAVGYNIYEPSVITDLVCKKWRQYGDKAGFTFLRYELLREPSKDPLIGRDAYVIRLASPSGIESAIRSVRSALGTGMLFGILAWPPKESVCKEYFAELPDNLGDLQEWGERLGIPVKNAFQVYQSKELQLFGGIPVTLVVPRPQRVIGSRSQLELINIVVNASNEHRPKDGRWDLNAKVMTMGHRTPLTLRGARDISSQPVDVDLGPLLFLGCGAVGSKVILHMARSGQCNMTLVDYDELSPHNLIRHGLLHESLGMNKAQAIKNAIEGIFYADKRATKVEVIEGSALDILIGERKEVLKQHSWLIDTTASPVILNVSKQADLPGSLSCCRCEIADRGRLGFLSVEGSNRNPRLDDLRVLVFDMAIENSALSRWLRSDQELREGETGSVLEEISVGISCSSETMRLSDEFVSIHAASFAMGFRRCASERDANNAGRVQISQCSEAGSVRTIVREFNIPPMIVLTARNDPAWQVRLKHGLEKKLKKILRQASPNETGGLLIGVVDFKNRTVYVTRIIPAPPDSKSHPYAFVRGIQDIPEKVSEMEDLTGGMLGYVGEWHTHPSDEPDLSGKDKETISKIRRTLDSIPLPTHVMIVTSRDLYSYVFSPQ